MQEPLRQALCLPREPQSAAAAREAVGQLASAVEDALLDDLRLLVTELIANRVQVEPPTPDADVSLDFAVDPATVSVTIRDAGPRHVFFSAPARAPVTPRTLEPDPSSGYGLYLIDRLADRWKLARAEAGVEISFELDREGG